jgi:hypothetical protein
MGRPSMHAATLHPHIAASFGTEFNPQLYKQSMHVLLESYTKIPCLQVWNFLLFSFNLLC